MNDGTFSSISFRHFIVALAFVAWVTGPADASAVCDGLDKRTTATADALFDSARNCDSMVDAVFLMIIGQIRAVTDMTVFPPESELDQNLVADLYTRLYYHMGGAGPDELFRNGDYYHELTGRIRDWRPTDLPSYEPGWAYSSTPSYPAYFQSIERSKSSRLQQLGSYFALISDDEYFDLHVQADEILARNNNTLTTGTADAEKYSELSKAMNLVKERIRQERSQ